MTYYLILIFASLTFHSSQNDLKIENLKGKVKSTLVTQYDLWGTGYKPFMTETIKYNPNGYKSEISIVRTDNHWNVSTYFYYNPDDQISHTYFVDKSLGKNYNVNNFNRYDSLNRLIEYTWKDSNGGEGLYYKYKYSGQYRVEYNSNKYIDSIVCKLDSAENIIEKKSYSLGKLSYTSIIFYNLKNQFVRSEFYENGKLSAKTFKFYNENDDLIEHTNYNESGMVENKTLYSYQYDKLNNWVLKEEYFFEKEGLPIKKEERRIEYYD